jgi:hypothetical protein
MFHWLNLYQIHFDRQTISIQKEHQNSDLGFCCIIGLAVSQKLEHQQ